MQIDQVQEKADKSSKKNTQNDEEKESNSLTNEGTSQIKVEVIFY